MCVWVCFIIWKSKCLSWKSPYFPKTITSISSWLTKPAHKLQWGEIQRPSCQNGASATQDSDLPWRRRDMGVLLHFSIRCLLMRPRCVSFLSPDNLKMMRNSSQPLSQMISKLYVVSLHSSLFICPDSSLQLCVAGSPEGIQVTFLKLFPAVSSASVPLSFFYLLLVSGASSLLHF